ncbi:histidine kinase [Chelatococcus reniformis]|uniref:Histidine kinase n=2 Tax=Chelatococcus reniformis TaxID=1494448 RepID=A0A916UG02_9HYPH|nr:histidine kinase [Chelatococcus reniformis]
MACSSGIRVGCSGWTYRHWRGAFYPDGMAVKRWFAFYAERFDTVEINNSFYRLPKAETFDGWRQQAPQGFRYAVKANRFITQAKKLKECQEPMRRMMAPTRHLGPTLGPILYQLPPTLGINLERLEAFLLLLPADLIHVFEFRHASWYTQTTLALLGRFGAGFVAHDLPGVASPRWATGPAAYVRFHGGRGKYSGRYADESLLDWSDWMIAEEMAGRSVWAYFNNDLAAAAVHDAQTLKGILRRARPQNS